MKYGILRKSDGKFLKMVTPSHPLGYWCDRIVARTFNSEQEAEIYLNKFALVLAKHQLQTATGIVESGLPNWQIHLLACVADLTFEMSDLQVTQL